MIAITFILLGNSTKLPAQNYSTYEVKAVYLYHFAKFVDWPDWNGEKERFVIGIYGVDPFGELLPNVLGDKKVKGINWIVQHVKTKEQMEKCDMLFISGVKKYELIHLIELIENNEILTIGDNLKEFCETGGHINFTPSNDRYRVEVNQDAIKKAGLVVSSRLLAIARLITYEKVRF